MGKISTTLFYVQCAPKPKMIAYCCLSLFHLKSFAKRKALKKKTKWKEKLLKCWAADKVKQDPLVKIDPVRILFRTHLAFDHPSFGS